MNKFKSILIGTIAAICLIGLQSCEDKDKDVDVTGISLNKSNITLEVGSSETIKAVVTPEDATDKAVKWTSTNDKIATVKGGKVTAVAEGTAVITAIAGGEEATCIVKVTAGGTEGVLINGVVWATCNVDAPGTFTAKPEDKGMYYQWNRKIGWSKTDPLLASDGSTEWNLTKTAGASWEKANDPSPEGWRVPTKEEIESLAAAYLDTTTINGVQGALFGSGDNTIFLPKCGLRIFNTGVLDLNPKTKAHYYWSSTPVATSNPEDIGSGGGFILTVSITGSKIDALSEGRYGLPLRCVKE